MKIKKTISDLELEKDMLLEEKERLQEELADAEELLREIKYFVRNV